MWNQSLSAGQADYEIRPLHVGGAIFVFPEIFNSFLYKNSYANQLNIYIINYLAQEFSILI